MPSDGLFPPAKRDRRARIHKLQLAINRRDKKADKYAKQVILNFILEESVSQRKINEYITLLKRAGKIDEMVETFTQKD